MSIDHYIIHTCDADFKMIYIHTSLKIGIYGTDLLRDTQNTKQTWEMDLYGPCFVSGLCLGIVSLIYRVEEGVVVVPGCCCCYYNIPTSLLLLRD